jgi:hypothetical protein
MRRIPRRSAAFAGRSLFRLALVPLLLIPLLAGCAGRRLPGFQERADLYWKSMTGDAPALEHDFSKFPVEALRAYPMRFKLTQRVILEARGKQYDFLGYLLARAPGDFRALGLLEMGGSIFDFEAVDLRYIVHKVPPGMPLNPIFEGVMPDIAHLFLPSGGSVDSWPEKPGRWIVWRDMGRASVFEVDADGRLLRSWEMLEGRIARSVEYSDYRAVPGWDRPLPGVILVNNPVWRYRMEVRLISFENLDPETTDGSPDAR